MSYFSVHINKMDLASRELEAISKSILAEYSNIDQIQNALSDMSPMRGVRSSLRRGKAAVKSNAKYVQTLSNALNDIARQYQKTEEGILNSEGVLLLTITDTNEGSESESSESESSWWESFWEDIQRIFDGDPNNDDWFQKTFIQALMNLIVPGSFSLFYIWENIDEDSYEGETLRQVILGNFSDDCTAVGIVLSVIVGMIPVVGTVADVRDIIADIYNLIDDGPEAEEWVSLVFSVVAFIPLVGDLAKHFPELGKGINKIFRNIDDVTEIIGNSKVINKLDDVVEEIGSKIDNVAKEIRDKIDDVVEDLPGKKYIDKLIDAAKEGKVKEKAGEFVKNLIQDRIEELIEGFVEDKRKSWGWT